MMPAGEARWRAPPVSDRPASRRQQTGIPARTRLESQAALALRGQSRPQDPALSTWPLGQSSHRFAVPFSIAPSYRSSHPLRTSPSTRAPGASVSLPRVVMTAPPPVSPTVPQT